MDRDALLSQILQPDDNFNSDDNPEDSSESEVKVEENKKNKTVSGEKHDNFRVRSPVIESENAEMNEPKPTDLQEPEPEDEMNPRSAGGQNVDDIIDEMIKLDNKLKEELDRQNKTTFYK